MDVKAELVCVLAPRLLGDLCLVGGGFALRRPHGPPVTCDMFPPPFQERRESAKNIKNKKALALRRRLCCAAAGAPWENIFYFLSPPRSFSTTESTCHMSHAHMAAHLLRGGDFAARRRALHGKIFFYFLSPPRSFSTHRKHLSHVTRAMSHVTCPAQPSWCYQAAGRTKPPHPISQPLPEQKKSRPMGS